MRFSFIHYIFILIVALSTLLPSNLSANCDMAAMISRAGHNISWKDYGSNTFFTFLQDHSSANPDGYGIICAGDDGLFPLIDTVFDPDDSNGPVEYYGNQTWYLTATNINSDDSIYDNYPGPMDAAQTHIINNLSDVAVVLGHDRNGTGGIGSHPFRFEYDDRVYTFMHNGSIQSAIKSALYQELGGASWFDNHPPNWTTDYNSPGDLIDSEVLFHWIMSKVTAHNGDVFKGVLEALTATVGNYDLKITFTSNSSSNTINFVLSDGEALYLFRNADDDAHQLAWEDNQANLFTVKTQGGLSHPLNQFDFICIPRYGDPTVLSNFLNPTYELVSGTISDDNWSGTVYITDDATVPAGHTLNINGTVKFATHAVLTINGTVNLNAGAEIYLENSSTILIEDDPALFLLNWGSKISGRVHTTYESIPPGGNAGGERAIPGDRIIARNGGIIKTGDYWEDYLNHPDYPNVPVVEITSHGDYNWDGIFIEDPLQYQGFWFVNCDISGIQTLSIGDTRDHDENNMATLNLCETDMHDAGHVVVMDKNYLQVTNNCTFTNNNRTPIAIYESRFNVADAIIENNDGDGIMIMYEEGHQRVMDCQIRNNNGSGIYVYGVIDFHFFRNYVETNDHHGLVSVNTSFGRGFEDGYRASNHIINNGGIEYFGMADSYDLSINHSQSMNYIHDLDGDSGRLDHYVLAAINWDGVYKIPMWGNDIRPQETPEDTLRYFPMWSAFNFEGLGTPRKEKLDEGFAALYDENYEQADVLFNEVIGDYPDTPEAAIAANGLYKVEIATNQNFSDLREFLLSLTPPEGTPLHKGVEDIITRTFMKENDYNVAIQRLEEVIANPPSEHEMLMALIDEAYCHFQLAKYNNLAGPLSCTVRPTTITDFQRTVGDLQSQLLTLAERKVIQNLSMTQLVHQNYPNPFNPSTTIAFDLPVASSVELTVYNIAGQKTKTLLNEYRESGSHRVTWHGADNSGQTVASGIYFYQLKTEGKTATGKMLLLK